MNCSQYNFSVLKQKTHKKSEVILRNEQYNFSVLKQKTNKKSEVILRNELFSI